MMFVSLLVGLVVAIPFIVTLGEYIAANATRLRQPLITSLGTVSLGLGIAFGTLFFSSAVQAFEPPTATAPVAPSTKTAIRLDAASEAKPSESNLPEWVDQQPQREGDRHATPVASDFFDTKPGALKDLDEKIRQAADQYVDWWLDREGASKHVRYPVQKIKQRWLVSKEPIVEHRQFAWGEMYRSHALLEFTPEFRRQVKADWNDFVAESRLWQMGLAGGGVLVLLLTLFGYFRMDNATRGFYTGRLQFIVALAILALIGAALYFAKLIPWV